MIVTTYVTDHMTKYMTFLLNKSDVKIAENGLHFYFYFYILFYFIFLEQLGLGLEVIGHTVTSVTTWWYSHNIDHETWKNGVEVSRTNDVIQYESHMLTSCSTHGHLG